MSKTCYVTMKDKQEMVIETNKLVTEYFINQKNSFSVDTIIKGKIQSLAPSLNAVFVDIGDEKTGYLPVKEKKYRIGDELIVQIKKERVGEKGASLSDVIYLAGQYAVAGKGKGKCGVSSKITDKDIRNQLKQLADEYNRDEYFIVIRTNALHALKESIKKDIEQLFAQFDHIMDQFHNVSQGYTLHQADNYILKMLKKYYDLEKDILITDDIDLYNHYYELIKDKANIKLYTKEYNLFDYYNITSQLNTILFKKIWLKSGGYLLINYTEAMTVIDVNSGKATNKKEAYDTFLQTNIEAAIESARQIRLRNIGGIIIIDFIKSENKAIQKACMKNFKEIMVNDKMQLTIGGFTKLGLFEVIRQKSRSAQ
ncbi:MAG: ribonuclease E/G [Clostridiales bacterium]|nr:ribonuclease E/G [Clostridiales bacterium]